MLGLPAPHIFVRSEVPERLVGAHVVIDLFPRVQERIVGGEGIGDLGQIIELLLDVSLR